MKKLFSLLLAMSLLASMFTFATYANELGTIAFYNAEDNSVATQLDGVDNLYANVTFTASKTGTASVMVAHYDIETGKLEKMESIDSVSMTAGVVANFTTSAISVADTDLLKVFAWDEATLAPLTNVGTIERDLLEELPTATVTAISTDADFALNFAADEVTDEQLAFYGDWEADFVFTANKAATFNANGTKDGYLVGQYDEFGPEFVKVPATDFAITAGTPVSIMDAAGLNVTFRDVVETVKEFDCGVDYADAYLKANDGLEVSLALVLVNPENGNTYTIAEKAFDFNMPTATVTEIDVAEADFALNFKADEATESQVATFGDWKADFVFTTNKDATFNANGTKDGYLVGQYDEFGPEFVKVPAADVTVTAGVPVNVLGSAGMNVTYRDVVETIKDFDCGVNFADSYLKANDGLEVSLALVIVNPVTGEAYTIAEKAFDFTMPTATVTEIDVAEADFALNFKADEATESQVATFGDWKADFVFTTNKDATFNANGTKDGYLVGQYDEFGPEIVKIPATDLSVTAGEPVSVMDAAGMDVTYRDVVETVKEFNCGVNFTEAYLKANDGLEVSLALVIVNPVTGEAYTIAEKAFDFTLPTATVTELDVADIKDVPLTYALNFKADPSTASQLAMFGDWYADYEITINKTATFNLDGTEDGYLAGQYDSWSPAWVQVPKMDITLTPGTPLKIMETAAKTYGKPGLKYTYQEVYDKVKDFDCGIYFSPEFLAANDGLEVTLCLKMYNPANEAESYIIGDVYTYNWTLPTATVTHLDTNNLDVEADFAMNFKANEATEEQLKTFGNWKADYAVTISKDVALNANGEKDGYLLGQYDEFGAEWVKLPATDLVVPANTTINVLESAGMDVTYRDIVETVKDFDCGINFSKEFLAANDGVSATVELRIYNPLNPAESYVIGDAITRTWKQPTATVTELDVEAIEGVDLDFALNFKADESTQEQLLMFGDWYADYELTVNKTATFNANGNADGFLSGQYDAWSKNWVSVPFEDATLEANTPVRVMETAAALMGQSGLKLTYADIVTSVKDFNCGLAFTPEFLVANPDLEVTLALKMYNPNNENESYVVGRTYTFTPETIPSIDKFIGKAVTYNHTLDTVEANTVTYDFAELFDTIGGVPVKMEDITVTGATYADGKITVEGFGTKTITVTDNYYCNTATATVVVNAPVAMDKFTGNTVTYTHTLDTIEGNTVTYNFADLFETVEGANVKAEDITVEGATYADGKITVTGLGTITVTATDNFYCNIATATVTVNAPANVNKFTATNKTIDLTVNTVGQDQTVNFEDLFTAVEGVVIKAISVTVDNGASFTGGVVTVPGKAGTYTVTATDNFYCNIATATVTVNEPANVDKFTGKAVTYTHTLDTIEGNTVTYNFDELFTNNGYDVKDITVEGATYADGKITVTGIGTFTVTATDNFYCNKATATITVKEPANVDKWTGQTVSKKLVYGENTVTVTFDELFTNNGYTVKELTVGGDGVYENGVFTFTGAGTYTVTVTDNFYCNTATATVIVEEPDIIPEEKFVKKFDKTDFMYRIGNQNEVAIEKIFVPVDGFVPTNATVTVTPVEASQVTADITATTLKFNGTGVVKVSIVDTADPACLPTELYLEVVDATNVTGVNGTISGNTVLVNNCSTLNGFTVSGDNTFYGNGFTVSNTNDGRYLGLGSGLKQGIITVKEGGTLENTVVRAAIFPIAALYSNQVEDYYEVDSKDPSKIRYYYQLSAVAVSGDSTISNCHIYGARNNIYVGAGNVTVKDTILEAGVLSNMQIESGSEYTVTLEDVTTIQYQNKPTVYANDSLKNNTMLGFGVIVGPNTSTNPNLVLKGNLKQYNWVNADDMNAVSDSYARSAINSALAVSKYQHSVNGQTSVNMGIVYLNTKTAIIDNQTGLPYALDSISVSGVSGQAYSLSGAVDTQIFSDYENADKTIATDLYKPQFKFDDDLGGQYIENVEGCDEYLYTTGKTVNILFTDGDTKVVDLAGLVNIEKYTGEDLGMTITCVDENGVAVPVSGTSVSLTNKGTYTVTYTVTDTLFYAKDGQVVADTVTYTFPITLSVSLKDNAVPDARFAFNKDSQKMGYYKPTLGDVKQYLPFLKGLQIYDHNGQSEYLRFNGDSDFNKIASITITGYSSNKALVEVKLTDGGVINTRFLARANSGGASTYTGSIKTKDNTVYFVNGGGTSNSASTTTSAYWYVDYYTFTGNNGVTITSAQQTFNSSGSSVSTPSGNFSTTIKATVTYDANGGSCVQTIGYATSAATSVTLPTPKRGGFLFAGWYTAPTGGTRVGGAGDSYAPSANITLYAQWGKPCDVSYDANGGTASVTVQTYNGTALSLPNASRDGYWFLGWYTAPTGGEKIGDAGEGYHPGGAITLYAQWQEAISYTVTYNANSGSVSPASATYEGTALTLPNPTRTGYTFNGWYTAASGGTKVGNAGAEYTPSSNITLYAQWTIGSYTVKVSATNATVKINNTTVANNGSINIPYGTQVTVDVTYSQSNSRSTTIKGADGTTYNSPFNMPAQTVTVTASSSGSCFTEDTLITMGDGSQKAMKDVTKDDTILTYNFFTGCYEAKDVALLISHGVDTYAVANLTFSDGTTLRIVGDHGVFDYDLNDYVYINIDNMDAYIGHTFVKENAEGYDLVTLVKAEKTEETLGIYSLTSAGNANAFAEGMLTLAPPAGFYNWIEMGEKLRYDTESFQKDIETYGLYTLEDFGGLVTEEQFIELNGAYLKIAVEKGIFTWDYIVELIGLYVNP
ncbi:MAG: hypothetical protein E7413_02220 [Ruminococcaceae bacterium]|nr:hypothetical protein [Oscillospiraceae bacterium]